MSEKKIIVPEEMLNAAKEVRVKAWMSRDQVTTLALEAALRWLSENPIVPSKGELERMYTTWSKSQDYSHPVDGRYAAWVHAEWQRRMFLAQEPEITEEVKDLLWASGQRIGCINPQDATFFIAESDRRVLEAFHRGQRDPSGGRK